MIGVMAIARRNRERPPRFYVGLKCSVCSNRIGGYFEAVASLPTQCNAEVSGVKCGGFMSVGVDERPD
jgi:hypothetical protein